MESSSPRNTTGNVLTTIPDTAGPSNSDAQSSRKRTRNGDTVAESRPKKKAKGEKVVKVKISKRGRPSKSILEAKRKEKSLVVEPKWTISPSSRLSKPKLKSVPEGHGFEVTNLIPRLWTNEYPKDRDELLAILPEMEGKTCANGISWVLYDNPLLILDNQSNFFEVSTECSDKLTVDLVTKRHFTCPSPSGTHFDLENSLSTMTLLPSDGEARDALETLGSSNNYLTNEDEHIYNTGRLSQIRIEIPTTTTPPFMRNAFDTGPSPPASPSSPQQPSKTPPLISLVLSFIHRDETISPEERSALEKDVRALPPIAVEDDFKRFEGANLAKIMTFFARAWALIQLETPTTNKHPAMQPDATPERITDLDMRFDSKSTETREPMHSSSRSWSRHSFKAEVKEGQTMDLDMSKVLSLSQINGTDTNANLQIPSSALVNQLEAEDPIEEEWPEDPMETAHPLERYIPSPIPLELQVLVDAYIFGKPLTIIASNHRVHEDWSLLLPEEYGYVVMGYFRIIGIEEFRVSPVQSKRTTTKPGEGNVLMSGEVQWRFRLQWAPGGEECIWPNRRNELQHAWWITPPLSTLATQGGSEPRQTESKTLKTNIPILPEEVFPTTLRYQKARTQHPEYRFRDRSLQELYYYILPPHLLMTFGSHLSDSTFPRGWVCSKCGRMNFQKAIRHRKCSGKLCKDVEIQSYYLDLFLLRDPQDRLPLTLPYNVYPSEVFKAKLARFEGEMKTLTYFITSNLPNSDIYIKHIFTGNLPHLQDDASKLLERLQVDLEVTRKRRDNGPYFTYSIDIPPGVTDPNDTKWPEVPDCVNEVKDVIIRRAKWYADVDDENLRITRIEIYAWVTDGSRKNVPIRAKKKAVVLLCLGCNTILTIIPYAIKGAATLPADVDEVGRGVASIDNDAAGWIAKANEDATVEKTPVNFKAKKGVAAKKEVKSVVITLVHGDALVFFGDDFEYSIKREGTAFLLMGSCKDSK